jgi:hypothetical protein
MDLNQFQVLLNELPLDADIKAQALDLFNGGKQTEALALIENILTQKIDKLDSENPEAASELKAAEAEYASTVEAAVKEFDAEMAQIKTEAKKLETDTSKELDAVRMTEVQENIQNA